MNKNEHQPRQVMIVLWKWDNLTHVNAKTFSTEEFEEQIQDIYKSKVRYFQELKVEESEACPNPLFVQVSIYNDNEQTRRLFNAVLSKYLNPEDEIMLFLHRANFYNEEEVASIRSDFADYQLKCFLFADGRDYIYYPTKQAGLLNSIGGFFNGRDSKTDKYVETFDKQRQIVRQPYFDRVWVYYRDEFQSKVFALKQEIFDAWLELLMPDKPEEIPIPLLVERLNEQAERVILPRIKSFLGYYLQPTKLKEDDPAYADSILQRDQEERAIANLERTDGQSYLFDDAVANFQFEKAKGQTPANETYLNVQNAVEAILFGNEIRSSKTALRKLAYQFNALINILPGDIS